MPHVGQSDLSKASELSEEERHENPQSGPYETFFYKAVICFRGGGDKTCDGETWWGDGDGRARWWNAVRQDWAEAGQDEPACPG